MTAVAADPFHEKVKALGVTTGLVWRQTKNGHWGYQAPRQATLEEKQQCVVLRHLYRAAVCRDRNALRAARADYDVLRRMRARTSETAGW